LGATVAIRLQDALHEGRMRPDTARDAAVADVVAELTRVSQALRPMRERAHADASPGPLPGSYRRPLDPRDAPQVTVLQRCCWVDEAVANDTLAIPALHESPDQVREWLATWRTLGLWPDGRLLGMVRARRQDLEWHVSRLAVVPDLRGRGLGRWLLHTAEAVAEPDCRRIVLFTGARNRRTIGLYRSEGYRPAAPTPEDGAVRLTKDLTVS